VVEGEAVTEEEGQLIKERAEVNEEHRRKRKSGRKRKVNIKVN